MKRKSILLFVLHAGFLLALLGSMPGSREVVPRAFQAVGNVVFASLGDGRSVRFQWADPAKRKDSADTRMIGRHHADLEYRWRVIYNAHRRWFWPAVTLLAMILATPMGHARRAVAVVGGLSLFSLLFLAEVALLSLTLFGSVAAGGESSWIRNSGLPVVQALFNSPITNFSAIFFLWAWLAQPARGIDVDPINEVIRRLLSPAGSPPGKSEPPDGGDSA